MYFLQNITSYQNSSVLATRIYGEQSGKTKFFLVALY